ncbi:MAG: DarT ssDNA thymidine ADP-ribosyltransferase family protein [Longimicrobiales bacterium]
MKPDADEILAFIDRLGRERWLGQQRRKWPFHLYHYTDVSNAASIIRHGCLYSRSGCGTHDVTFSDAADQLVIGHAPWAHAYVRLYFAPRTPTQYWMEGIRPSANRRNNAHCPVPVFFVFDSKALLVRDGCKYTNGNLSSAYSVTGSTAQFLSSLPFHDIYHRGPILGRKPEIISARCAEVLFESQLDLQHLTSIVCRSGPEREMLLYVIGRELASRWKKRIRLEQPGEVLFERRWFYVKEVTAFGTRLHIQFNRSLGEHERSVILHDRNVRSGLRRVTAAQNHEIYALPRSADRLAIQIQLLGCTAYEGALTEREVF